MQSALEKVEGVSEVVANSSGSAVVTASPDVDSKTLIKALKGAGYGAKVAK